MKSRTSKRAIFRKWSSIAAKRRLIPAIAIVNKKGQKVSAVSYPDARHLDVDDGEEIRGGTILVKIPRDIGKTRDITGGLPRVTELFEARSPNDPAVVS